MYPRREAVDLLLGDRVCELLEQRRSQRSRIG